MDEPSNVSDDDDGTFDDTFVLVDDDDYDDDDTEVMSLVEVLGSSPPPPPRRRMITAGTTPRSSPFGSIPIGPVGPLGPVGPPPLRSPNWASQGSRTPSLARKSSMMSFRSLRRKVSNMSIGGGSKD